MGSWLQAYPPTRKLPRLWVERFWLIDSKEPLTIVRKVDLQPGMNIVWAKEPESNDASGLASAGHGVGKTSLCLLLRYCLGDDAPSIAALREKAAASFPRGGVAAKIHIDGIAWLVFRPYEANSHSTAGVDCELEALFSEGATRGGFPLFLAALSESFITRLPASSLPGSSQALEWKHLLAWCVRDQKTRFDGFFHWRDGDGLGFRRSRQDPPLFVRAVLGLLDAEGDRLIREVESSQTELKRIEEQLLLLEREQAYGLTYVEARLRTWLRAGPDVPIFTSILGPSLEVMVADLKSKAEAYEAEVDRESERLEDAIAPLIVNLGELRQELTLRTKEKEIAQALLDANQAEYTRLLTELQELNSLVGLCRLGQVEFSDCHHISTRRSTYNLPQLINQRAAKANEPQRRLELQEANRLESECRKELETQESLVNKKRVEVRRLQVRKGTSEAQRNSLEELWDDLKSRVLARENGAASQSLEQSRTQRDLQALDLNKKRAALLKRDHERSERATTLHRLTQTVAARLLGESGQGRFIPDSDDRLFELKLGGEAYQVLEVLLGDITCLIDSATTEASHYPGFLVHDCPREADMSERLYREFLSTVADAAIELSVIQGSVPFQYIVTTTSPPPEALKTDSHLALVLQPGSDEGLLFRRRLGPGMLSF
ncbi:hypothetical protein A6V36_20525 [Paraburkholderia ginsengiterrae]|uniref:Uncharacterized protein n=2 Tax=Paraburkholderia ginsengiterrae TaxID=1462993 RepID=A0A1A9NDE0_9BURK|nr:hypothetical protein A6V36_20525 [Paraburkholderia ginsengiterrae]OAJ64420.1 hypothetical protein A6V37_19550 [Paraburkholderia ginsengiterrae]